MITRRLRPLLILPALVFAGSMLLYSVLWMIAVRQAPQVALGFETEYLASERAILLREIKPGSPAEAAGLRRNDRVLAIDGRRIENSASLYLAWIEHRPGDVVHLQVARAGRPEPIRAAAKFGPRQGAPEGERLTRHLAEQVRGSFPAPFVAVGIAVLLLHVENSTVWRLALLFGCFVTIPGMPHEFASVPAVLRPFAMTYQTVFLGMLGALFYRFFAVFPTRSPLDRRLPWLKWLALALSIGVTLPGLGTGSLRVPQAVAAIAGSRVAEAIPVWYSLGFLALGLLSLFANFVRPPDAESRRKIRVVFWGTAAGVAPGLIEHAVSQFSGYRPSLWVDAAAVAMLFLFPLSFAYAVVKHRVLEIPVLLKRSARYLLVQRGFTFLLSLVSIGLTLAFALAFTRYLPPAMETVQPAAITLGAVFGTILLWGGSQVHKQVSGQIDRAFFRRAYDARRILEDLADKTRTASGHAELARLLEGHLHEALQPSSLLVYLRENGALQLVSGDAPRALKTIPAGAPALAELAGAGEPREIRAPVESGRAAKPPLWPLRAECVAPMTARGGDLMGLLVLGARLSEEPYSREDKRLLGSVASQAATALENFRLAAEIAERTEAERRAAREMEIAKEVQARLLPGEPPRLATMDCAARCVQARQVGGDYFDFLDLGAAQTGFVLADVSGKGVHAALLMANLQAHLRSLSAVTGADPARLLDAVNRSLWKSTAAQHYATLWYGIYDDRARRLQYVNCGHSPALWLRGTGDVERLAATATVVGLFERWECAVRGVQLEPGDLLAIFSDGITEAMRGEEEFGEDRLLAELRLRRGHSAGEIVTAALDAVQRFSGGAQSDDLTLLIAKVRA
jgi:sigma-B regulation protein RsbU (phosphoserine phosphatase)